MDWRHYTSLKQQNNLTDGTFDVRRQGTFNDAVYHQRYITCFLFYVNKIKSIMNKNNQMYRAEAPLALFQQGIYKVFSISLNLFFKSLFSLVNFWIEPTRYGKIRSYLICL